MSETINLVLSNADYFLLVMCRAGALVMTSPIFGRVLIPTRVRLGLSLAIGYLFFMAVPPAGPALNTAYNSLIGYLLLCASEIIIGVCLGYVTNAFFGLTFIAGHLIDMQIGFGMVNVYDIQNQTQAPIMGNLLNITLMLMFFISNGHLRLIDILYGTLRAIPPGTPVFVPGAFDAALQAFTKMFLLGVMVGLPVVASGLMIEICFGAVSRAVPQLHMMVVGIPLKLIVGFIIVAAVIPVYANFSGVIFDSMFEGLDMMFGQLSGN
ncbi:MAG: flagellar biosynthetic protein FliR [Oscillospiraceae bacterium]|jgi:flagellar biosynthetic protein FliR|nr:flagellar biosynthetic protein FliR [Oscillospiraceae bacterium]